VNCACARHDVLALVLYSVLAAREAFTGSPHPAIKRSVHPLHPQEGIRLQVLMADLGTVHIDPVNVWSFVLVPNNQVHRLRFGDINNNLRRVSLRASLPVNYHGQVLRPALQKRRVQAEDQNALICRRSLELA